MLIVEQLKAHKGAMKLSRFAEIMNVSYMTAYRWARNSNLPATKVAGTFWVDPEQAARWWQDHSTAILKQPPIRERGRKAAADAA